MDTETQKKVGDEPRSADIPKKNLRAKLGGIAKVTGKVALTAVCPPLGGAAFDRKERFRGAVLGTLGSLLFSVGATRALNTFKEGVTYDNPVISTIYFPNESTPFNIAKFLIGTFLSPVLFYQSISYQTALTGASKTAHYAMGGDVITFDKEKGRYALNFDVDRKFRSSEGTLVSCVGAQRNLSELSAKGDVLGARKAAENLVRVRMDYETTKALYEDAVKRMNSELESLSGKLGEQTK